MKQIIQRFNQPGEPSVKKTHLLKEEVLQIKSRLSKLELESIQHQLLMDNQASTSKVVNEENLIPDSHRYESESRVRAITQVKPLSYHIMIKLVINNFVVNQIALLDSEADRNCIREGLVPTKYLTKGTTSLYSATGEQICINYILHNAHICNNGICLQNDFVVSRDINEEIILETPFLT